MIGILTYRKKLFLCGFFGQNMVLKDRCIWQAAKVNEDAYLLKRTKASRRAETTSLCCLAGTSDTMIPGHRHTNGVANPRHGQQQLMQPQLLLTSSNRQHPGESRRRTAVHQSVALMASWSLMTPGSIQALAPMQDCNSADASTDLCQAGPRQPQQVGAAAGLLHNKGLKKLVAR